MGADAPAADRRRLASRSSAPGSCTSRARAARTKSGRRAAAPARAEFILAGSFLVGLSTFQAEFDFAVPQFRLVCHPVLLMLAAGIGARGGAGAPRPRRRARCGRRLPRHPRAAGPARRPDLRADDPALPALHRRGAGSSSSSRCASPRASARSPSARSPASPIGTIGLAAEWGWSHVWWIMAWPSSLFPEGAIAGFVAAVAGGVIGGWIGRSLPRSVRARPRRAGRFPWPRWPRWVCSPSCCRCPIRRIRPGRPWR